MLLHGCLPCPAYLMGLNVTYYYLFIFFNNGTVKYLISRCWEQLKATRRSWSAMGELKPGHFTWITKILSVRLSFQFFAHQVYFSLQAWKTNIVKETCPTAIRAHLTERISKRDSETPSATETDQVTISQTWQEPGRQQIAVYQPNDWWTLESKFWPFGGDRHLIH